MPTAELPIRPGGGPAGGHDGRPASAADRRRRWARVGSLHDVRVRVLRILLPAVVGALAAVMLLSPFSPREEVSFILDKDEVAVAEERMRATDATLSGLDNRSRPFSITAGSAVQATSAERIVDITDMAARITLTDGPAAIEAASGRYDIAAKRIAVPGRVAVTAPDGYRLDTGGVEVDLGAQTMTAGRGARVTGSVPLGDFSADIMSVDLDARIVRLEGNARLVVKQGAFRR